MTERADAGPIVGIDLGTTNSLVAVADERGPRVLPDESGRAMVPSVVRYERDAEGVLRTVVGRDARVRAGEFPRTTITGVKRLMGRSRDDAAGDLAFLGYEVIEGENRTARVSLPWGSGATVVSPPEVSAVILRRLKDQASAALGVPVTRAVVTVPAYFDDAQRQATRDAGRLAGLEVVRLVAEPTAAALAYGIGLRDGRAGVHDRPRTVAVYDLGGGTFDISILKLTPGASDAETSFFQVLATAGDTHLGGDDVDHLIVDRIADESGAALSPGERASAKLAAEAVKCELSTSERATASLRAGGTLVQREVSRGELESLIEPWVARTLDACAKAVRDARKKEDLAGPLELDAVVMVGGSTRIPLVRRRVAEFFGLEPYTAIDPDQVVALGAAVQAGVISGALRGSLLLDVIPLSLGIETVGGAVAKIIVRNSTVPTRATEMFSTSVDGQTSITLTIHQGEREMAADCRKLGEFRLRGLPPMPAGIPQVEVEFLVDANGVLNVSAVEKRSGKRAALQVVPNHGLTRDEVARIEAESFTHAREDMARHRVVDLVVNSTLDLKWIGERLNTHRDLLDAPYREALLAKMALLQTLVERAGRDWTSVDPNELHHAKNDLDRASMTLQEVGIRESLRQP